MDLENDKARTVLALVTARSWRDQSYKSQFLSHPREVLAKEGLVLPEGFKLVVLANTPTASYVPLSHEAQFSQDNDKVVALFKRILPIPEGHEVRLVQSTEKARYIVLPLPPAKARPTEMGEVELMQLAVRPLDTVATTTNVATTAEAVTTAAVAEEGAAVSSVVAAVELVAT